jgi:hypothetical protein
VIILKLLSFTNINGNPKVSVRKKMKEQSMKMAKTAVENATGLEVVETARKTLAIQIAIDEQTEDPVYFEISGSVTTLAPEYKSNKSSMEDNEPEQEIKLFD